VSGLRERKHVYNSGHRGWVGNEEKASEGATREGDCEWGKGKATRRMYIGTHLFKGGAIDSHDEGWQGSHRCRMTLVSECVNESKWGKASARKLDSDRCELTK